MESAVRDLIVAVHASPCRLALTLTGGGASAVGWLLSVPGGSRTVLEARVPYAEESLARVLGGPPASFCSAETSRALALRSLDQGRTLLGNRPFLPDERLLGVGATAALRSDRPKKGDHRFHVAVADARRSVVHSLTLAKEARDRAGEEDVLARTLLNAVAEACGLAQRVPVPLLAGEEVGREEAAAGPLGEFLAGRLPALCQEVDGRLRGCGPWPPVLLSGSFNPLHEGHVELCRAAVGLVGGTPAFELTVVNADKGRIADEEVRRRTAQFLGRAPLWLTHDATFAEKARRFPGAAFVVGVDTAERIVQPRFYGDSAERMAEALADLRGHGGRFLVAGRADDSGRFHPLEDLALPEAFRDLFAAVPESLFRRDVSSTKLRQGV